jgi:glycosyltransferase involved in cell wall biosynthesis
MPRDRVLFIVGQDMKASSHHRGEHIVLHLAKRYSRVDLVSITKMYDGHGTDPIWKKGLFGLRDLMCRRVETIHNVNVVHHVVRFPYRPAVFDYLFRDFWTYANLRKRLEEHYDVCILGHPRLAFVALRLKRLGKVDVLIYDDWDYFPGHRPGDLFWRYIMRHREHICVRSADGVVSVSRGLQELRRVQGAKQTAFVPNGVDYAIFGKAHQKTPHPPTLLYMGTLSKAWGADLPVQALPIIKRCIPAIRYILLGRGPDEAKLRAMVKTLGLEDCVVFYGWQEYQHLPSFMAQADIGVATYRDYDFVRYAHPLKIIEYMAGGLPVIGTQVGGEVQTVIEEAAAGETIEFSREAFASAALDLLSNRSKYELYSANAVTFARDYDWEQLLDRELAFIQRLHQNVDRENE